MVLYLRSLAFNLIFYVNLIVFLIGGIGFFFTPRSWSIWALKCWARSTLWWLKVVTGITMEVRGEQYLRQDGVLIAGKHQSLWETFAILPLVRDPAMVLKRELLFIPFFGWFAMKFRMISVDRGAAAKALKRLIAQSRQAIDMGRQIIIFPEGTRRNPDAEPDYKPGAAALYLQLKVDCVPMALNSGLYWPRRQFLRHPGRIIIEFLPPIKAGLKRKAFSQKLEMVIEEATRQLVVEGRSKITN